jgi:ABC-type transport system involved in multi-copper enzyme maturation permease subunit
MIAVAHNTFRESVRDKVLYVLLFFAGAAILCSKALGWITIGQDIKVVSDISLAALEVFGVLIAIFIGTNLLYKEIDKRTLYTILARPMRRYEFVLGKYLGLVLLLGIVTFAMGVMGAAYILLLGGTVGSSFIFAVVLTYMEFLLVTAFALLMSCVTTPILGALIVFSVFVLGHATTVLVDLPPQLRDTGTQYILEFVYYALPNLNNFNLRSEAANAVAVNPVYVLWSIAYGCAYSAMLLAGAAMLFEEKDV